MPRCPNCIRETMRTKDWACYLCGYPLASPAFKAIDKTYSQVREERLYGKKRVVEEQVDISYEPEREFLREMQDVPVVTCTDREETDSMYRDPPLITEEVTEEQLSEQGAIEQEDGCETTDVDEGENKPEEVIEVYQEAHEETEISACNIQEPEIISETTELNKDIDTAEEELADEIEAESAKEEEPCKEPAQDYPEPVTEEPVQEETEPAATADIYITVDELLAEYAADYNLATAKYTNKILRVSGYAAAIDVKEVLAINYIRLTDESFDLTKSIQCMFDKKYASILMSLQKGQPVSIQGKYTGSLIAMRMTDCIVIQP